MKADCKGCFGAANNDCENCEEERGQKKIFTNLTPHFKEDTKGGALTGTWIEADTSFRELLDGIRIQQREASDKERIRRGIPHIITK